MIVSVCGSIIALEHIFVIHPIPKDFTVNDFFDKVFFRVTSITNHIIDIEGESPSDIAVKCFNEADYSRLTISQQTTAINTAIANLERVREKLILMWSDTKNINLIPKIDF